ncbi:Cell surface protein [Candidatus Sumerlaea chitinivorans]|uniref:Cell surface protein n=1 Tax=Sumerlaea chitinivorans TaxID=2250252 RepID=A0A2Z4Y1F2_SUMC1|nr:Cell surface protein [Candidatus Sumerlaea chitinivorans]
MSRLVPKPLQGECGWRAIAGALLIVGLVSVARVFAVGNTPVKPTLFAMPMYFVPNVGLAQAKVDYVAEGAGYWVGLNHRGFLLALRQSQSGRGVTGRGPLEDCPSGRDPVVVKFEFVGARDTACGEGEAKQAGVVNVFKGNDPSRWRRGLPTYGRIRYRGVYAGVDVVYYGNGRQLEWDLEVAPGVDVGQVRLRCEVLSWGAQTTGTLRGNVAEDGSLVIEINGQPLRFGAPTAYDVVGTYRRPVVAQFRVANLEAQGRGADENLQHGETAGPLEFGFVAQGHNPEYPLVIDPVIDYSTYLGGPPEDSIRDIEVDADGNAYVCGFSYVIGSSDTQVVVHQFRWTGEHVTTVIFGGSEFDYAYGIALHPKGNVIVVVGGTDSEDFPVVNAFQERLTGVHDGFVSCFDIELSTPIFSTYFGGSGSDTFYGVATDTLGNVFVVGETYSNDFPVIDPYAESFGGIVDAVLVKFTEEGGCGYSTYLGGNSFDYATAVAVDQSGNPCVGGGTLSNDFPVETRFQTTNRGAFDGFLSKFANSECKLLFSSYLGGSGSDSISAVRVASDDSVLVAGLTGSNDFPVSTSLYSTKHASMDGFITKFDKSLGSLTFSTYLGGDEYDAITGVDLDRFSNVYACGYTSSSNFPTLFPVQNSLGGGFDAFLTGLHSSGERLWFSTYAGGENDDYAYGVGVWDVNSGGVLIVGKTFSPDYPTRNAYTGSYGGNGDGFLTFFADDCNCNGTGDYRDLSNGVSQDCNSNGIPDECDIYPKTGGVIWSEDFESGQDNWYLSGLWHLEVGHVCLSEDGSLTTVTRAAYNSETFCDYNVGMTYGVLELTTEVLVPASGGLLRWSNWAESESIPFTTEWWTEVLVVNSSVWQQVFEQSAAVQPRWEEVVVDLSAFAGQRIRIRFVFDSWYTDGYYRGWYVDDIRISEIIESAVSLDCNSNEIPDECDLSSGRSLDCNANSVPDECDIGNNTSSDCNWNSVPDECEPDCNQNGVPDECDIWYCTSIDCNGNSYPDECDITSGVVLDYNDNGVPDECDIASGAGGDCNGNAVLDEYDILTSASEDCNGNKIPDECEMFSYTSDSPHLSPWWNDQSQTWTIMFVPEAETTVVVSISTNMDSSWWPTEQVRVYVNDTFIKKVPFVYGGEYCGISKAVLYIAPETFNTLITAAGGHAAFRLEAVNIFADECYPRFVAVEISYLSSEVTGDINANGVLDECEFLFLVRDGFDPELGGDSGWRPFGFEQVGLGDQYYDTTETALVGRVWATEGPRFRFAGHVSLPDLWLPYSAVGSDHYVRGKFYVYAKGITDWGTMTEGSDWRTTGAMPNVRLRLSHRYAQNSMLEIFNHVSGDPGASDAVGADIRPSSDPANPSLYRVDFDPVDTPYLVANGVTEGIWAAYEAYSVDAQDQGLVGLAEVQLGVYPTSLLPDTVAPVKVYAPSASDAGTLGVVSPTDVQLETRHLMTEPGVVPPLDPSAPQPQHGQGPGGITLSTVGVPADRLAIAVREFDAGSDLTQRVRVEPNTLYKIRFHVTSANAAVVQPQMRCRARTCRFLWSQKFEVGGAWNAGPESNTDAQQALPGVGCQNPDRAPSETVGGWYTLLMHSPLNADIRPEYASGTPLEVRMPGLTSEPGPGVNAASLRDLRVGFDVLDTLSGSALNYLEEGEFTLDRIEIRAYPMPPDGGM